jgi:hypothetical protein
MKSWKTTVGGIAAALGAAVTAAAQIDGAPKWLMLVGAGLAAFGSAFLGIAARDNGVTSEQAGAQR